MLTSTSLHRTDGPTIKAPAAVRPRPHDLQPGVLAEKPSGR